MTDDIESASVDEFIIREDSETRPTEAKTIELGGKTVEIEAELAEEGLMTEVQNEPDADYVLRRILAKFETPDFPTETVDGEELLAEDLVENVATKRAEQLVEEFMVMNGADRESIQKAKEKQKEAMLEGNLENGVRVNRSQLATQNDK